MTAQPPATSAENAFAADLFQGLPPRYDLLAEVLSFGQNGRWRDELVARIAPSRPSRILDVATGTAGVAIQLARQTGADVTGIDISEAMLGRGRERVRVAGLDDKIHLQVGRAEELPFPNDSFDAVSFTYLLRYVRDPQRRWRSWHESFARAAPWPASTSSSRRTRPGTQPGGFTRAQFFPPRDWSSVDRSGGGSDVSSVPTSRTFIAPGRNLESPTRGGRQGWSRSITAR